MRRTLWIICLLLGMFFIPDKSNGQYLYSDTLNFSDGTLDSLNFTYPFFAFMLVARTSNVLIKISPTGAKAAGDTAYMLLKTDNSISLSDIFQKSPMVKKIWWKGSGGAGYIEYWGYGTRSDIVGR